MKKHRLSLNHFTLADAIMLLILAGILAVFLVPFAHVIMYSLSNSNAPLHGLILWPRQFTLDAYKLALTDDSIVRAFLISTARTLLGTAGVILVTFMSAFAVFRDYLPGVKFLRIFFLLLIYVNGGTVATYLTILQLKLGGSFWVYILPMMITPFFMILTRTYMRSVPSSLEEAALIDGAGYFGIFWRIMMPVCSPILSTVAIFSVINHWNAYTDVVLYNQNNTQLYTLQYVLYSLLQTSSASADKGTASAINVNSLGLKFALTTITMLPILIIYPFAQKYIVQGIMIGAVKG